VKLPLALLSVSRILLHSYLAIRLRGYFLWQRPNSMIPSYLIAFHCGGMALKSGDLTLFVVFWYDIDLRQLRLF
jgi:hypothetical protein